MASNSTHRHLAGEMTHQHKPKTTRVIPFRGCVQPRYCNPKAHGTTTRVSTCSCGAVRHDNVNPPFKETGNWGERASGVPHGEAAIMHQNESQIMGPPGAVICMDGHSTTARYRNTDILRVPYMTIYLDTGGKQGIIMRSRMNQAARMLHLSLYLHSSKEGHWTVETPNGSYEYRDGMRLMRARGGQHEYVRYPDDPEPDP